MAVFESRGEPVEKQRGGASTAVEEDGGEPTAKEVDGGGASTEVEEDGGASTAKEVETV